MYRTPYHNLLKGNSRSFGAFVRKTWLTTRRDNALGVFRNPIELWNYKYRAYAELARIAPVTFLKYEDILEDPGIVFSASGIQPNSDHIDVPAQSVKGSAETFESYKQMYRQSFWLTRIEPCDMKVISQHLDARVLEHLDYRVS